MFHIVCHSLWPLFALLSRRYRMYFLQTENYRKFSNDKFFARTLLRHNQIDAAWLIQRNFVIHHWSIENNLNEKRNEKLKRKLLHRPTNFLVIRLMEVVAYLLRKFKRQNPLHISTEMFEQFVGNRFQIPVDSDGIQTHFCLFDFKEIVINLMCIIIFKEYPTNVNNCFTFSFIIIMQTFKRAFVCVCV